MAFKGSYTSDTGRCAYAHHGYDMRLSKGLNCNVSFFSCRSSKETLIVSVSTRTVVLPAAPTRNGLRFCLGVAPSACASGTGTPGEGCRFEQLQFHNKKYPIWRESTEESQDAGC